MTAIEKERTTADLLLEWDRTRPRSQQRELGWSEVGGCRRRAGYRLAGTEPTNPGGSVQAVLGTAIHEAVQQRLNDTAAEGDLIEHAVSFAGIPGHIDRYEADTQTLVDVKTTSSRWLEHIKVEGPDRSHLWQTNGYAASLNSKGTPVRRIIIDYIARDTGELYRWTGKPDLQMVRASLAWLKNVRETPLDMLNRDYDPTGPFCAHCPFYDTCWGGGVPDRDPRSVLLVEDQDAAGWAAKLDQARRDKKDAEAREKEAVGALDAKRPNDSGKSEPVDVGYDKNLQWQISETTRLDADAVRAEYRKTGAEPPTKASTTKKLVFLAKPEGEAA